MPSESNYWHQQTETTTDQAATENAGPGGGGDAQMGGNRGGSFPSFTQSAEVESLEITVSSTNWFYWHYSV